MQTSQLVILDLNPGLAPIWQGYAVGQWRNNLNSLCINFLIENMWQLIEPHCLGVIMSSKWKGDILNYSTNIYLTPQQRPFMFKSPFASLSFSLEVSWGNAP